MAPAALGGRSESQGFRQPPVFASCSVSITKRPGVAHAISPDVRFGHPGLHSLDGNLVSPSRLREVFRAARLAWATPLFRFAEYQGLT